VIVELTAADRVWNRACEYEFTPTRGGDRLLKAAIALDGLAQNAGLGHALDVLNDDEAREAAAAFRHFDLPDAAQVVEDALSLSDEEARDVKTEKYYEAAASLDAAFAHYYADHPEQFDAPP
jgi:hypothetical protein